MSYVQGTKIRLRADFYDPVTRLPFNPDEVVVTVQPPEGDAFERRLSDGDVVADPDRLGRFFYVLDTSDGFGTWQYQFEDPDNWVGIVARKALSVTRRIDVVP